MNHRIIFLDVLAQNEDDTPTRMIYADWLEENGEYEEADRQRRWPAAKAWLLRFCQDVNPTESMIAENAGWQHDVISFVELLNLGHQAVKDVEAEGGFGIACDYRYNLSEALNAKRREFWKNWSVVTGIPLPADMEAKGRFVCCDADL